MSTKELQRRLNAFNKRFRLKHKRLTVDGNIGPATRTAVKRTKYYLGYTEPYNTEPGEPFQWRLAHPRSVNKKYGVTRADTKRGRIRRQQRRKALHAVSWSWAWAGSRGVTNEVIRIVHGRYSITSRKRWQTFGNPGSDHYMRNVTADAVDFATENNQALKDEISRRLGGPNTLPDYGTFLIHRKGKTFRIQIIAVTHGTGPHLHVGVKRA